MSPKNNPSQAGYIAGKKELFGNHSRFAVYPVHTRFDAVEWFVADAETPDPVTGNPSIIRQEPTKEQAMAFDYTDNQDEWLSAAQ